MLDNPMARPLSRAEVMLCGDEREEQRMADRTLALLTDDPDSLIYEADVGEYDGEAELMGLLVSVAADQRLNGSPRDADIVRIAVQLIDKLVENRGVDYWLAVDRWSEQ